MTRFNKITSDATEQTQKTENLLRQSDSKRYEVQVEKEVLEKKLVELNEINMLEQSKNYKLSNKYKFLSEKSTLSINRVTML